MKKVKVEVQGRRTICNYEVSSTRMMELRKSKDDRQLKKLKTEVWRNDEVALGDSCVNNAQCMHIECPTFNLSLEKNQED